MSFLSNTNSHNLTRWLAFLLLLFVIPTNVQGQGFGDDSALSVESWYQIKEGTNVGNIYVRSTIKDGFHTYSQYHGGIETKTLMVVPESEQYSLLGKFEPDQPPHKYRNEGSDYETFEEEVIWSAPFTLAEGVDPDELSIELYFEGQVCNDLGCQPPLKEPLQVEFVGYDPDLVVREPDEQFDPKSVSEPPPKEASAVEISETPEQIAALAKLYDVNSMIKFERLDGSTGNGSFWTALVGAFLGGMLLNLMPCVFPVLGLKVMGFVEQAGNDPKKIKMHGLAFAFGLIFSMWVLSGIILAIKASGNNVTWGQQMGNSYFVGGIVILLFVLGLNLAGVFEMGLFMTRVGGDSSHKEGYTGSFISGVITTLVATPCSGPFLGAAMGYTLSQPAMIALFLFTIFGLGIAMPYLVMSFFPSLIKMLPRPGAWMETFKKLMAFTMFAAAAFFAQSFGWVTGYDGINLFLLALCVISLGLFFYGKYSPAYIKSSKRYIWGWLAPLLICGAGLWMFISAAQYKAPQLVSQLDEDGWKTWVPGRVEQQLALGKPVWVDYTANW